LKIVDLLIIGIVIILVFFLLYQPSEQNTLWLDDCGSVTNWAMTTHGSPFGGSGGTYSEYTGDGYGAGDLTSFRITAAAGEYGYMGGGTGYYNGYVIITTPIPVTVPLVDNRVNYVFGGSIKIKQFSTFSMNPSYSITLYTYDSSGATLAEIPIQDLNLSLNAWHKVELSVTPQHGIFYVDGVAVKNDTASRLNVSPAGFGVYVLAPERSNGVTEVLIDELHIQTAPPVDFVAWIRSILGLNP
jgi:hypothetical protein